MRVKEQLPHTVLATSAIKALCGFSVGDRVYSMPDAQYGTVKGVCITPVSPTTAMTGYLLVLENGCEIVRIEDDLTTSVDNVKVYTIAETKCDCGASFIAWYGDNHESWCAKYRSTK